MFVVVAAASIAGISVSPAAAAPCFGAAAHDPQHPCFNPTRKVFSLDNPDRRSSLPCHPTAADLDLRVCAFGAPAAKATSTFALIGDSHALHWQPALSVAAGRLGWRGLSVTTSACYFSASVDHFLAGARGECTAWYREVRAWVRRHPEVSTIFVSQLATTPLKLGPGETYFGVKSAGWRRTWTSLPRTVKHVVVIRDVPESSNQQFNCTQAVEDVGKRPGPACLMARSAALKWDTAVSTARLLGSPRYQSVDLTEFFCGSRYCYPVIGGVLVHSDVVDHITNAYSKTLGPYLEREVRRLTASW